MARKEKLKSIVKIDKLFTGGHSFWMYPFSVYYRIYTDDGGAACQMLVSVGKHFFKHAVDRNRLKRIIRESYRLQKEQLVSAVSSAGIHLDIGLVYKAKDVLEYKSVETGVRQVIGRLLNVVEKNMNNLPKESVSL